MRYFHRALIWLPALGLILSLQGCLLEYFFTPKISAGELPVDPQIEPLRTAYISHCGRCHLLIAPRYFNREHPIDAFAARYVAARILTRREADEAAAYIRILAANIDQPTPRVSATARPTASPTTSSTPSPEPSPSPSPEVSSELSPNSSPENSPSPVISPRASSSP